EPVCLVSFNYDLLLDNAIDPSGAGPQPLENHFDAQLTFKLFKPHGSVDWAQFIAGPKRATYYEKSQRPGFFDPPASQGPRLTPPQLIDQAHDLKLSGEYVRANASDPT